LHYAIWKGHKIIAQLLISKGADVNAKIQLGQTKGSTPLDMAIDESQNRRPPPQTRRQDGWRIESWRKMKLLITTIAAVVLVG